MSPTRHLPGLLLTGAPYAECWRATGPGSQLNVIPEESGTTPNQTAPRSVTALLCDEPSIAAQKTKSLCCAAAGIISPASSTAKAPIPHETLREAGPAEPTLIASNCPPAQLAKGYKQSATDGNSLSPLQATAIKACISNAIDATLSTPPGSFATTEQMAQGIYGALQAAGFLPQQAPFLAFYRGRALA